MSDSRYIYSFKSYKNEFLNKGESKFQITQAHQQNKLQTAVNIALDIRKFEIELYWKRANYFWTIMAVTFGAYGAVRITDKFGGSQRLYLLFVSCLGVIFSFAWYLAIRGSKYWQNHWERVVDALEDDVAGPLYKTLSNPRMSGGESNYSFKLSTLLYKSGTFSVSKINQAISFFVFLIWILIMIWSLTRVFAGATFLAFKCCLDIRGFLAIIAIFATVAALCALCGATSSTKWDPGHSKFKFLIRSEDKFD